MAKSSPKPADVEAFLAALDHPFKAEILALRRVVLAVDPAIGEGIKWNAPSFRTTDDFATFHLRARGGVQIILHHGAKSRAAPVHAIEDPTGLLEWLGPDRASVKFRDGAEVEARREAFTALLRRWIAA